MVSKRISAVILTAAVFTIPAFAFGQPRTTPGTLNPRAAAEKRPSPQRYEKQVAAYLEADKQAPPAACAILFIGSASISGWRTITEDLAPAPVFARGLGASTVADQIFYFDKLVAPYKPRAIFLYATENDIVNGLTPEEVLGDMKKFMDLKTKVLGDTPVYFISAKASPARLKWAVDQQKANELALGLSRERSDLHYIDVAHGAWVDGKLFGRLKDAYIEDGIHLNTDGRSDWTGTIKPYVDKEAARRDACK
jgi:hypothetical protein